MKFLVVEPFPLPILIPLGPKYSPEDPVFKLHTHTHTHTYIYIYIFECNAVGKMRKGKPRELWMCGKRRA